MEKLILFEPGYDKRTNDPKTNCGISGMHIRFVLKGDKGAVQFLIGTDWYPKNVQEEYNRRFPEKNDVQPLGFDIGYHSHTPFHEDQYKHDNCPYLDGKPCYYDGSGLRADELIPAFLERGTDAVWEELEEEYKYRFEKGD